MLLSIDPRPQPLVNRRARLSQVCPPWLNTLRLRRLVYRKKITVRRQVRASSIVIQTLKSSICTCSTVRLIVLMLVSGRIIVNLSMYCGKYRVVMKQSKTGLNSCVAQSTSILMLVRSLLSRMLSQDLRSVPLITFFLKLTLCYHGSASPLLIWHLFWVWWSNKRLRLLVPD